MAIYDKDQADRVSRAIAEAAGLPGNAILDSITADSNGRVSAEFYVDPEVLRQAINGALKAPNNTSA
jgi:hypothetical protein